MGTSSQCASLRSLLSVILCIFISQVTSTPAGFPADYYGLYGQTGDFAFVQDLQTWTSAQTSCNDNAWGNLASVADDRDWATIVSLLKNFWYSTTNPSTIMYQNKGPKFPAPYVGFNNTGLTIDFQGCAWIGLSNIRPPTYVTTTAAAEDSSAALTFVDGTPTSLFWNNIRTAPLSSYGWPYYGKASQSAVQSGEKYATCSMVCLTPSTDPGPSNPTQVTTYYADCSSIALPYLCKKGPITSATILPTSNLESIVKASSTADVKVHKRSLLADSDASTLIHFNAPEMTSELRAQAFQLASSVSLPPRPAIAYKRSLGRVLLGSGDDGSSSKSSAWPPTVTLWPTAAGNASCYPFGVNQLCVFPGNVKMTQADWMFTCWDAGLQPFGIYTYSQLYMLTWGSQIVNVPVGTVRSIVSQATATPSNPLTFMELYSDTSFVNSYTRSPTASPLPDIAPFQPFMQTSNSPAYGLLNMSKLPYPSGATCDRYGFGCSLALWLPSTSIGNGLSSAANSLSQVSPSSLNGGFCLTPNRDPMPRPPNAAAPQALVSLSLYMFNQTMLQILGNAESRDAFIIDLVVAVAGALPDISKADVIIPSGQPLAQFAYANYSNKAIGTLGAVLAINLPFTVNTTTAVNNYLNNLLSIGRGMMVLPPVFIAKYNIVNTSGVTTSLTGNLDQPDPPGDNALAIGVGVGVGVGLPGVLLLVFGIYKFLKDSNSQYSKV